MCERRPSSPSWEARTSRGGASRGTCWRTSPGQSATFIRADRGGDGGRQREVNTTVKTRLDRVPRHGRGWRFVDARVAPRQRESKHTTRRRPVDILPDSAGPSTRRPTTTSALSRVLPVVLTSAPEGLKESTQLGAVPCVRKFHGPRQPGAVSNSRRLPSGHRRQPTPGEIAGPHPLEDDDRVGDALSRLADATDATDALAAAWRVDPAAPLPHPSRTGCCLRFSATGWRTTGRCSTGRARTRG